MRVLVTGGAGFIGTHVVRQLREEQHEVVVLDADARAPTPVDGVRRVTGDIRDQAAWTSCLEGVDAVCHLAAKVGLGSDLADVTDYVDVNDGGTATGLLALHRAGYSGRLVLASSMVVYGEGRYRCSRHGDVRPGPRLAADLEKGRFEPRCPSCGAALEGRPVAEWSPLDPRNVYAATKVHQEHLFQLFGRARGSPVTRLRYHNVYGPDMPRDTPYAGVAALFLSALRRGERPQVFEDGAQQRDFVHVDDVARCTVSALTADEPVDGPLNVASGRPHTVGELAEALADTQGPGAPRPEVTGAYRLGDVRHIVASPRRARQLLGFKARIRFAEGVAALAEATPAAEP
ncbi:MAG: NAD-dependent epimerase/dehydratase family protein [Actinomycetota bacterium]|nr:NAD-dependent epimerase/dehydratase family protein [Actinomycetota bacterium]